MATPSPRPRASEEKTKPSVFWPLAAIVVPLVSLIARVEIIDGEKLPRQGPYVLAPSHSTEFDPLIVALAVWRMGRAPRFMAKESLFKVPVLGWALRATGMVPVARSSSASAARQTIAASELLVEHGRGVIVYPEGTLTRDPDLWPMRGKTGAVRLALADDIPLIPMAHWGAQDILPRLREAQPLAAAAARAGDRGRPGRPVGVEWQAGTAGGSGGGYRPPHERHRPAAFTAAR